MTIEKTKNENTVTLCLEGWLDYDAAPELKNAYYNASQKKMKIVWSKSSKSSGYVVQTSLTEKFEKVNAKKVGRTSAIFSVKSGQMYYLRVRGYRKAGGKIYYSAWSRVRRRKAVSK